MFSLAILPGHAGAKLPQQGETKPKRFRDFVPEQPPPTDPALIKPNSLTLVVDIDLAGKVTLNHKPAGTTRNTRPLAKRLKQIFAEREQNRVYEPGGEAEMKVAKAVFMRVPKSARYVAVVRVVDAIKAAGGNPIGLQIADIE